MKLKGISDLGFHRIAKGELDWAKPDPTEEEQAAFIAGNPSDEELDDFFSFLNKGQNTETPPHAPDIRPDEQDMYGPDEYAEAGYYRQGSPQQMASRIYSDLLTSAAKIIEDFQGDAVPGDVQYGEFWRLTAMELHDLLSDPQYIKGLVDFGFENEFQEDHDFDPEHHLSQRGRP
jgi:hypothetical protein